MRKFPSRFRLAKWIISIFFIVSILFPVVTIPMWCRSAADNYRREFKASNQGAVVRSLDEWSTIFGGSFGLVYLRHLSQDPSLMPSGRIIALEISTYISTGKHQADWLRMLKSGWYAWPFSCDVLCAYIYDGFQSGHWTTGPEPGEDSLDCRLPKLVDLLAQDKDPVNRAGYALAIGIYGKRAQCYRSQLEAALARETNDVTKQNIQRALNQTQ